jgi:tetratricopeptide (TPR) repeat protein
LRRESGDRRGISLSLHNLGLVAEEQGEYERARALHAESLALRRELGAKWDIALSLANLGTIAEKQGDYEQAWRLHLESLALKRELGDKRGVADSCACLAVVATRRSCEEAAQLAGAATRIYQVIAAWPERQQQQQLDQAVQAAQEHLTPEEYAAAWAQGQGMSWEEVCACVLDEEDVALFLRASD